MTTLPALRPRPSMILAIELIGLEDPEMPEEHVRAALSTFVRHLGEPEGGTSQRWRLHLAGRRALRTVPVEQGSSHLFWELLHIVHVQAELVRFGIFVRGAITLGDVAAIGDINAGRGILASRADAIMGPGVSEAERLRDMLTDVPRVIVDPRLILEAEQNADLRAPQHTVAMELGYIRELLHLDADGVWFVDYLKAFESEVDEPPYYIDFLEEHARQVKRHLDACAVLDSAARSFTWLWRYHNRVIEACYRRKRIDKAGRARLRIPARGPLLYAFPPSAKVP